MKSGPGRSLKAIKMRATVGKNGRISLPRVPLPCGSKVEIIVLQPAAEEDDLIQAAESTLAFWDNPIDDRVWNDA